MPDPKEVFFVGVRDPIELRKEILSCSKDAISMLKRHERFKELRKEKAETAVKLKKSFDDITILSNKLRQLLPKTKLRALGRQVAEQPGIPIREERPVRKPASGPLDRLEQELAELESKLERLK